jgi:hypothetical protein
MYIYVYVYLSKEFKVPLEFNFKSENSLNPAVDRSFNTVLLFSSVATYTNLSVTLLRELFTC